MDAQVGPGSGFGGCVAAGTPEAAEAGAEILEAGGNAFDAAVAVSLVLGVTEPAGSGIGGQGMMLVQPAGGEAFVLNGSSFSPLATPERISLTDLVRHRASTIPSLVRLLDHVFTQYGSGKLSWERLVEQSVRWALEGYRLTAFRHATLAGCARAIRTRCPAATGFLLDNDAQVPEPGSTQRNQALAQTLRRLGREGADDFHSGWIARRIVDDMRAQGGWISAKDLERLPPPVRLEPIRGTYRDHQVLGLPPPGAGWVVQLALNILEQAPAEALSSQGPQRMAWLAEALGIAHRHRHFRPIPNVVDYEQAVANKTSKEKARAIAENLFLSAGGETTHFSLVDADGTAIAMTQSLNTYFGAKVAHPELGFLYNDYMREFVSGIGHHPYSLRPFAMPRSSMSATILGRDGTARLALGSPGDDRIISAVVQVASHWVDADEGIEAAVTAPRLNVRQRGGDLLLEAGPRSPSDLITLEQLGYCVLVARSGLSPGDRHPFFGGVQAVALEGGAWRAAADPRRDGATTYAGSAD